MPPVKVDGFWSLTMYDGDRFFVPNALNRYTLSQRDNLMANADGSVDIYLQADSPGKDKEANWLPAPKGKFSVMLRLYWPKEGPASILDGSWKTASGSKPRNRGAGRVDRRTNTVVGMGVACSGMGDPADDTLCRRRGLCCCGRRGSPDRHRLCRRVPRRGRRTPHRRALRHAGPGRRSHGYRGGADRLGDDRSSGGKGRAGTRHRVRRGHDRDERHRWPVPAFGGRAPSRTGISAPGGERRLGRPGRAHHPDAGGAERRRDRSRTDVQHTAACLRRYRFAGPLRLVHLRPDRAAPRLLPSARSRRRGCARGVAL